MFDPTTIDLSEFSLDDWTVTADIRESVALQSGLPRLTTKQWNQLRREYDLETRNIGGTWHCRIAQPTEFSDEDTRDLLADCESIPLVEALAAKPSVVNFGDFNHGLAVVNPTSVSIENVHLNTGMVASEARTFAAQLDSFTAFLTSTETMLDKRAEDLRRETATKELALHETRLKVETIRQKALLAQRDAIALRITNESLDREMNDEITVGKQLYATLSQLQE